MRAVRVEWSATDQDEVLLSFTVDGVAEVVLPETVSPVRTDGLWRTTCFESFWMPGGGDSYFEFNLSPSGAWAAYAFDGYRLGMRDLSLPVAPRIEREGDAFEADIDLSAIPPGRARIGLSAVIEEIDGTKSYWALRHPPGPPDFHHPDCFALELPALGNP